MIRRGFLRLAVLLVLAGVIWLGVFVCRDSGLLPTGVATQLALPESLPDPRQVLTLVPTLIDAGALETPAVIIQGTPYAPPTPAPTATPTPSLPENGRLLYLGLDENIYSLTLEESQPVLLGRSADFHGFPGLPWYSPDGRYALVARGQAGSPSLSIVAVDGQVAPVEIGEIASSGSGALAHQFYAFSPDSRRFLWTDAAGNLNLIGLGDGLRLQFPGGSERSVINQAAFYKDGDHVLLPNRAGQPEQTFLSVYQITPDGFLEVERLVELPGWQLDQFSVSPGGRWVAIVARDPGSVGALYLVDTERKEFHAVMSGSEMELLLAPPAWTEDGAWLLINEWGPDQKFRFWSYAVEARGLVRLLETEMVAGEGSQLAVARTFSPDQQALGLVLYAGKPEWESFWLAVLDGSYLRQIAQAGEADPAAAREYVTAISPDWTASLLLVLNPGMPVGSLYRAALDGTQRVLLDEAVPAQFTNLGPAISPDGKWVAYFRLSLENQAELCVIGVDGAGKRVLVAGSASAEGPIPGIPLVWLPKLP